MPVHCSALIVLCHPRVLPTSRLITAEADKTIKVWKEDPDATPETHPIDMEEWTREVRRHKRY